MNDVDLRRCAFMTEPCHKSGPCSLRTHSSRNARRSTDNAFVRACMMLFVLGTQAFPALSPPYPPRSIPIKNRGFANHAGNKAPSTSAARLRNLAQLTWVCVHKEKNQQGGRNFFATCDATRCVSCLAVESAALQSSEWLCQTARFHSQHPRH